jgi:hypothetical protein
MIACIVSPVLYVPAAPSAVTSNAASFHCSRNLTATTCAACAAAGEACTSIAAAVDPANPGGKWDPAVPPDFAFSIDFAFASCVEAKQLRVETTPGDTDHDRSLWTISVVKRSIPLVISNECMHTYNLMCENTYL